MKRDVWLLDNIIEDLPKFLIIINLAALSALSNPLNYSVICRFEPLVEAWSSASSNLRFFLALSTSSTLPYSLVNCSFMWAMWSAFLFASHLFIRRDFTFSPAYMASIKSSLANYRANSVSALIELCGAAGSSIAISLSLATTTHVCRAIPVMTSVTSSLTASSTCVGSYVMGWGQMVTGTSFSRGVLTGELASQTVFITSTV